MHNLKGCAGKMKYPVAGRVFRLNLAPAFHARRPPHPPNPMVPTTAPTAEADPTSSERPIPDTPPRPPRPAGKTIYTTFKLLILFPSPGGRGVRGEGRNLPNIKRLARTLKSSAYCGRTCVDTYAPQGRGVEGEGRRARMPPRPLRRNPPRTRLRLEKTPDPAGLERAVGDLIEWLKDPQQDSLRRAFTVWIKRVLIPGRPRRCPARIGQPDGDQDHAGGKRH